MLKFDGDVVNIQAGTYVNGRLAILLRDEDNSPYATLTVNIVDSAVSKPNCSFIDTNNVPNAGRWLELKNIAMPTGRLARSGFCTYPEYEFNMDELQKLGATNE